MFGISFSELFFILVIALIILGPQQLAQSLSKFWIFIVTLKAQFEAIKHDLYLNSGIKEIKDFEQTLTTTYNNLKAKIITPAVTDKEFIFHEDILYQPELDFDREPELFDNIKIMDDANG
jgi:Sec-independent protein translocase protein TatA